MLYSTSLPKSPDSAARARRFLDDALGDVDPRVGVNARLLVSELVANSIEHVSEDGDIELRVTRDERVLRVEVLDSGPGFEPVPRVPGSERGWGLYFTEMLAARWAIDREERSRVWFELALTES